MQDFRRTSAFKKCFHFEKLFTLSHFLVVVSGDKVQSLKEAHLSVNVSDSGAATLLVANNSITDIICVYSLRRRRRFRKAPMLSRRCISNRGRDAAMKRSFDSRGSMLFVAASIATSRCVADAADRTVVSLSQFARRSIPRLSVDTRRASGLDRELNRLTRSGAHQDESIVARSLAQMTATRAAVRDCALVKRSPVRNADRFVAVASNSRSRLAVAPRAPLLGVQRQSEIGNGRH
jgi:hypothetical protein